MLSDVQSHSSLIGPLFKSKLDDPKIAQILSKTSFHWGKRVGLETQVASVPVSKQLYRQSAMSGYTSPAALPTLPAALRFENCTLAQAGTWFVWLWGLGEVSFHSVFPIRSARGRGGLERPPRGWGFPSTESSPRNALGLTGP